MTASEAPIERLRSIVFEWPETKETVSHGSPTFWCGRKTFATFADNHHGSGRTTVWIKSTFEARDALVEADPGRFFVPPYVGPSGWLGVYLDVPIEDAILSEFLKEGYRLVATKRALKALAAQRTPAS